MWNTSAPPANGIPKLFEQFHAEQPQASDGKCACLCVSVCGIAWRGEGVCLLEQVLLSNIQTNERRAICN